MSLTSLARSALKFPLTATIFGVRQLARLATSVDEETDRDVRANFYRSATAAQAEFETNSLLFATYKLSDQAQQTLIDLTFDSLTLRLLSPSYLIAAGKALARTSNDAAQSLATPDARHFALEQIRNNFAVVNLVNNVDAPVRFGPAGDYPLEELLLKAYSLGAYPAVWWVEGLGENYAEACLAEQRRVRGMFTTGQGALLPEKCLLMMHAGAGIAFAKQILQDLTPWSSPEAFLGSLMRFF